MSKKLNEIFIFFKNWLIVHTCFNPILTLIKKIVEPPKALAEINIVYWDQKEFILQKYYLLI